MGTKYKKIIKNVMNIYEFKKLVKGIEDSPNYRRV